MRIRASLFALVVGFALVGCVGGGSSTGTDTGTADGGGAAAGGGTAAAGDEKSLTIWHFEADESAMGQAWLRAIEIYKEKHPDVTVTVEHQTFEGIQRNAQIILTGEDVPDLLLYNKGNATAGQLAVQGLIRNLDDMVAARGWDQKVSGALQVTSKYDENGLMGSGHWYGVPNQGEFVGVYYNKTMFDAAGVTVPTTFDEFESVLQTFVDQGITPIATAGAEYPLGQLWYQLVLQHADRQFINDYQLFENPVDWHSEPMVWGTQTLKDWIDKGYVSADAGALPAEDMGVSFINNTFPIMHSGSWWFGRLEAEMTDDWGQFLFPGAKFALGSAGNLWTIPTNAKNPNNAADFIDITLSEEVQNVFGVNGGLPIAGDPGAITEAKVKELTQNFDTLVQEDGLAFYPDWPVPGFNTVLASELQSLMNGSKTPDQVLTDMGAAYQAGQEQ